MHTHTHTHTHNKHIHTCAHRKSCTFIERYQILLLSMFKFLLNMSTLTLDRTLLLEFFQLENMKKHDLSCKNKNKSY